MLVGVEKQTDLRSAVAVQYSRNYRSSSGTQGISEGMIGNRRVLASETTVSADEGLEFARQWEGEEWGVSTIEVVKEQVLQDTLNMLNFTVERKKNFKRESKKLAAQRCAPLLAIISLS